MMHTPVLSSEVIALLPDDPPSGGGIRVVDATLDGGGHAAAILHARPDAHILGIEWDAEQVRQFPANHPELMLAVTPVHASYTELERICAERGFRPDAVLMDLGLSSWHYESSGRGFTFQKDEPLDMRFNPDGGEPTAADIVNTAPEEELVRIIREFGEERFAPEIAAAITRQRRREPVLTTDRLVRLIEGAVPAGYRNRRIHCATKTFQALRMAVNHELENVSQGLTAAMAVLKPGGRLLVISFHGGEDRIVREAFKDAVRDGRSRWVQRRTIRPAWREIRENPRARSAKMKVIEMT
ncbi:MAG TPA: 16S rRNA (cytosine(1402)-N(4))-methyltransferase RsmH [Candidatus Paceibacterota bacterium]|nr:16S rRNA (cytosine(1402)-N(4))-methyltransferase RsmH [Candidatus Paceibacterota bacterium]